MDDILLKVILPLSLAFIMFTLGLGLKWSDFSNIAKYPKAFGLGLINQLVLLPIVAFILANLFDLPALLAIGVMILALSPGGVTSNVLSKLGGGNVALSVSLTAVVTLISVITLPIVLGISMKYFMGQSAPDIVLWGVAISMFLITAVPVIIGMGLNHLFPSIQNRAGGVLSGIAVVLFAVIILGALAANLAIFTENLSTLGPLLVVMNVVLLALGLYSAKLMSLPSQDGTTIAIESGVQNGTVAIAVASLVFIQAGLPAAAVPAAVYGIVMYLVTVPFVIWRHKQA